MKKKSIMSVKKSKSHIKRGNVIYRILCEYLHIIQKIYDNLFVKLRTNIWSNLFIKFIKNILFMKQFIKKIIYEIICEKNNVFIDNVIEQFIERIIYS